MSNTEYRTCFAHVKLSERAIKLIAAFIKHQSLQRSNAAIKALRAKEREFKACRVLSETHFEVLDTYKVVTCQD